MQIDTLFNEYSVHYLPQIVDGATVASRIKNLKACLPKAEIKTTEGITYVRLQNYRSLRTAAGYASGSVNRELSVLSSAIKWGCRNGCCGRIDVEFPYVAEPARHGHIDGVLLPAFVSAAWARSPNLGGFVSLSLLTGQRKSAILSLKKTQLDGLRGIIDFCGHGLELASRRKARAMTPITLAVEKVLERLNHFNAKSEYIIPGISGFSFYRGLDRDFAVLCRSIPIAGITPHSLRHTAATIAIDSGVPLYEVSRFLGHSSVGVTQKTYIHHSSEILKGAMGAMEKAAGL